MDMKNWRKSSYSSGNGGNCVETADDGQAVAVRDTKNKERGPVLRFSPDAWAAFIVQLKKLAASQRGRAHTQEERPALAYRGASGVLKTALRTTLRRFNTNDRDTYLVQGYVVTDPEAMAQMGIPEGETVVEVPRRLMKVR
jgi:Domain of unknown function (DUF397)